MLYKITIIWKRIAAIAVVTSTVAILLISCKGSTTDRKITYLCRENHYGIPSTIAKTPQGEIAVIRWKSSFGEPEYTPQKRCAEVSNRFQQYQDNGTINYITTGIMNNQSVVCISSTAGGACTGLLFTLKPNENPSHVIQQLFDISYKAEPPLYESSKSPSIYIDFQKFLKNAPVEATK
ncbi:MAG: COP23 domain-containing protein [Rhizonema sp. PD38]|nr:COP23 domain-containing protein [Rhizonema sp. PD38]